VSTPRYSDVFLNTLMDSHQVTVRGELYYGGTKVGDLNVVNGTVTCDRQASVRRTATLTLDPTAATDAVLGPNLHPFGPRVRLYRGVRYASGLADEAQVFSGRVDTVDESLGGVELRCSDEAAQVVDARFPHETPASAYGQSLVRNLARALIQECFPTPPTVTFDAGVAANNLTVQPATSFAQERSDALDSLCTQLQAEWYAMPDGTFAITTLPGDISPLTTPAWVIDSGDSGVLVSRVTTTDRANVANGVFVASEPVGGTTPAYGSHTISAADDPTGQMVWGGVFGKVPRFYTGQQVNSTAAAQALAQRLALNQLSVPHAVAVECVVNPRLMLTSVVRVYDRRVDLDQMMYVQAMTIPLAPDQPMRLTLYRSLIQTPTGITAQPLAVPPGCTWRPDAPATTQHR
jgi:Domain of unknown function (DUF5047)